MRSLIISILVVLTAVSCAPDMQRPVDKPTSESTGEWTDSSYIIETDLTVVDSSYNDIAGTVVEIYDDRVIISSPNVNTTYTVDAGKIIIRRTETGLVEYIQVDNDILFKEDGGKTNHNYKFISPNVIEAQSGNTISGIMVDYKISKKQFYECNPYLKQHGLQIGNRVLIKCD